MTTAQETAQTTADPILPTPLPNVILRDVLFIVTRHAAQEVEAYNTPVPEDVKATLQRHVPPEWGLKGTYYTTNEVFVFLPDRDYPLHVPDTAFFEAHKAERVADISLQFGELIAKLEADPEIESVSASVHARKPEVSAKVGHEVFEAFAATNRTNVLLQL